MTVHPTVKGLAGEGSGVPPPVSVEDDIRDAKRREDDEVKVEDVIKLG